MNATTARRANLHAVLSRRTLAVVSVLHLAAYAAALPFNGLHSFLGGLAYPFAPLVALLLAVYAGRSSVGRQRMGWIAMAVAMAAWLCADLYYSAHALFLGREAPFPGPGDVVYYAGYVALAGAVVSFAWSRSGLTNLRVWADAGVITVVAGAMWWHVLVEPRLDDGVSGAAQLVAIGYPLLDLAVIAALIVGCYGRRQDRRPQFVLIAAAILATVSADAVVSVLMPETVASASYVDLGWLAGYWLVAMAAAAPAGRLEAREQPVGQSVAGLSLPYLAVAPLFAFVTYGALREDLDLFLMSAALVAAVFLLLRQWLTQVDNRRLYRQVAARTSALEATLAEVDQLRADAEFRAQHDDLTGLLNRRAWMSHAAARPPASVVILDIDHFKTVNDRYGHLAGDEVLQAVARRIEERYSPAGVTGRLGGEEFGVLLYLPWPDATALTEAIVRSFTEEPVITRWGRGLHVTVSAGVAAWQAHAADPLAASHQLADSRLFSAKRDGRARVVGSVERAA